MRTKPVMSMALDKNHLNELLVDYYKAELEDLTCKHDEDERGIGGIGNTYGGLSIIKSEGLYQWCIEDCCGTEWEQIPKSLFDELNKFQDSRE